MMAPPARTTTSARTSEPCVLTVRNGGEKKGKIMMNNRVPTAVSEGWDGIEMREIRVQIRAQDAFFGVRHGR